MIAALGPVGVRVPDGFAVTAAAFRLHLEEAGLARSTYAELDQLDLRDVATLARVARSIRERVAAAPLPAAVATQLDAAYVILSARYGEDATDVAVRSSATAEDLPSASFAGQQETYLNIRGREALDRPVRNCFASLFTDRAIVYRAQNGFRHADVALSVGIQKMVRSDLGSAGVIFTLDTESGFRDVVLITGAWGLGETVVQGRVRPDEFWVHKPTLRGGCRSILRREIAEKAVKLVYADGAGASVREVAVAAEDRMRAVLTDDEVLALARWALAIEDHYSRRAGRATPMDIEWARDGRTGELFIVQARPETVHSQRAHPTLVLWRRRGKGKPLVTGRLRLPPWRRAIGLTTRVGAQAVRRGDRPGAAREVQRRERTYCARLIAALQASLREGPHLTTPAARDAPWRSPARSLRRCGAGRPARRGLRPGRRWSEGPGRVRPR